MKSHRARIWIVLVVVITIVGGVYIFENLEAQTNDIMIVKLYSGGNLVATWDDVRSGRLEGNTYVFLYGQPSKQVRISGTYSAEVIRIR